MRLKNQEIDMLHGPLAGKIILFTLPIALSSMIQQLFNSADTAVVGLLGDANALAAVGTNTEIVALIVSISTGLAVGANLLAANRIGRNETDQIPEAARTALFLALIIGVGGCLLGLFISESLLTWIKTPDAIMREAVLYLRVYCLGYPFLLLYDFASAILRAHGDSRYPFIALVLSGIVNIGLNLFFVIVVHMGVAGVAAATSISTAFSAALVLRRLIKKTGLSLRNPRMQREYVSEILTTGIPAAVQGAVFCFANIFVQASVNSLGENAIAGNTVTLNFEYFVYYIITGFGQAATTFTGQNYAAGQHERCRKIFGLSLGLSLLCSAIPVYIIVLFGNFFCGLFTSDPGVIECAIVRMMCVMVFEPLCSFYEIPAGCLRGRGHSLYPAVATVVGTCVLRLVWIFTVFKANPTLPTLYHVFPLSYFLTIFLVNMGFVFTRTKRQSGVEKVNNQ